MVSEPLQALAVSTFWHRLARRAAVGVVLASCLPQLIRAQAAAPQAPPLTLLALLDSVRTNYPTLQAAASRVRAAQGIRTTAGVFGNPVLSYETDQTPFPGSRALVGMSRQTMITAMVPLESFYQRGPRVTRANAELRAAEADVMSIRQQVGLDASAAYYRLAIAQIDVETTQDLAGWLDSVVAYNRPRVREGVTSEADLIRSMIERDRVAAEGAMQLAELLRARAALRAYFPNANGATTVTIDDIPFRHPALLSNGGISDEALQASAQTRGEVRAANERVTASSAAISAERSLTLRQLGATVGAMQSMGQTSMIAGLSMPLPIFDRNRGEVQRANAERDVAQFELAAQQRAANAEVRGAYDAAMVLTARARLLTQRDTSNLLRRAEESRRTALGAYREGAVPLLQVIDAARSWAESRRTYYRTLFEQQQSILILLVAQGQDLFTTLRAVTPNGGSN
ncbi:MAG: TolC family protein [Gemmatimonadaceae bacterium]